MKKIKYVFFVLFIMINVYSATAQERIISFKELPITAQNFIKKFYPKNEVILVELEKEFLSGNSYEVKLQDGIKIDFDKNGDWTKVDRKLNAVPLDIVPKAILNYVSKKFPNNNIVEISRDRRKYEVELTNGLDLEFNSKGQFIKIDH